MELLVKLNQTEKNLTFITTEATCYQLLPLFAVGVLVTTKVARLKVMAIGVAAQCLKYMYKDLNGIKNDCFGNLRMKVKQKLS